MCRDLAKKTTAIVLIFSFLFMILPSTAVAMDKIGIVNEDRVNIRVAPGTQNTSLGKVNKGDVVTISDVKGDWLKVTSESGLHGWLAGWLVDVQDTLPMVTVVEDVVNVRSGPGTHFDKVGQVAKGTKLAMVAKDGEWYKVQLSNGKVGWVAGWLVQSENGSIIDKPTTNPTPNPGTGTNPEPPVKPDPPSEGNPYNKTIVVTGDGVNIRKGPSTNYEAITKVSSGTELQASVEKDNWLKVALPSGQVGWIAKWLTIDKGSSESLEDEILLSLSDKHKLVIKDQDGKVHIGITNVPANGYKVSSKDNQLVIQLSELNSKPQNYPLGEFGVDSIEVTGKLVKIKFEQSFEYKESHQANPAGLNISLTYKEGGSDVVRLATFAPGKNSSQAEFILNSGANHRIVKQENGELIIELQNAKLTPGFTNQRATFGPMYSVRANAESGNKVKIEIEYDKNAQISVAKDKGKLIVKAAYQSNGLDGKLIVLDPGHGAIQTGGWTDPGSVGTVLGLYERDVVLDISLTLRDLLQKAGAEVVMTHENGRTPLSLAGRAKVANDLGADIFVSVHANSNDSPKPEGSEVYYYAPSHIPELSAQKVVRKNLAQSIQKEIVKHGKRKDRGVKEANFAVLRETRVPSVLVEVAFISNPTEEALLNTQKFRDSIAMGIFKGIENYFMED